MHAHHPDHRSAIGADVRPARDRRPPTAGRHSAAAGRSLCVMAIAIPGPLGAAHSAALPLPKGIPGICFFGQGREAGVTREVGLYQTIEFVFICSIRAHASKGKARLRTRLCAKHSKSVTRCGHNDGTGILMSGSLRATASSLIAWSQVSARISLQLFRQRSYRAGRGNWLR